MNILPLEIGLCVSDLDRSLAFYTGLLGMSVVSTIAQPQSAAQACGIAEHGYTVVRLQLPTGERLKLFRPEPVKAAPPAAPTPLSRVGFAFITLIVAELAPLLFRLETAGYPSRDGIYPLRPGVNVALVDDPDGNVIELVAYDQPFEYRADLAPET